MEKVTLLRNDAQHKDHEVELDVVHAQNLLSLQVKRKMNHYSLPRNSQYEFKNGNLKRKSSPRHTQKPQADSELSESAEA